MAQMPGSFSGAYDFSNLGKQAPQTAQQVSQQVPQLSSEGSGNPDISVAALVIDVTPAGLANFVKISEKVPVLVEFHTLRSESAQELSSRLSAEVNRRGGDLLLLRIDGDHPQVGTLLQAFQVQGLPAVCALLMGQPLALFSGNQDEQVLKQVFDRFLILAKENGVVGRAVVSADAEAPKEPELPPRHKAGYEAIENGDYDRAVSEFEAALAEAPADVVAAKGLAQANLLKRTDGLNLQEVLAKPAENLGDVLVKADALAVVGHLDKAFSAILDTFAVATKEDRDVLRAHLLELFKVVGNSSPDVAAARIRLANLLY